MTPPRRGCLLVAAPALADPNFSRAVVLLLAYDEDGALGVVLNRPSDTPIAEIVPSWDLHASPPRVLFSGGPVQPNAAICVGHHLSLGEHGAAARGADGSPSHLRHPSADGGAELDDLGDLSDFTDLGDLADLADLGDLEEDDLAGYSPLTATIGTVDLHREPEDISVTFGGLRIFKGYSGWGPGQLDEEIAEKAWYVVDGTPEHILTADPEHLWERVLRSQGGWMSVIARHPADPSLN